MKVCAHCGIEIATRDGENLCPVCDGTEGKRRKRNARARANRRARECALESCGLVKVRGALGGVYWEGPRAGRGLSKERQLGGASTGRRVL
jgi:predicted RNA-binding Zn-ribbon protein involved in translation (DUF1610 family)